MNTTREVLLTNLEPLKAKSGQPVPIQKDQNLALKGKKEKHRVLRITETGTAIMRWHKGVKPEEVTRLTRTYGGWIIVGDEAKSKFISASETQQNDADGSCNSGNKIQTSA